MLIIHRLCGKFSVASGYHTSCPVPVLSAQVNGIHRNNTFNIRALNQGNISQQVARTEKVQNCLSPKFAKKFVIDYYFEIVQKLRFGIYDIDNKTIDLSDDDFLGQLEITLGQVRHSSHFLEGHDSSVPSVMFVPVCALSLSTAY